ncbi:ABC transporter substrate-binding protein [Salmonella enterica subsp. enterica serovar Virchow]|nr:ABC transporter substrate-binding protein [Salmonella enterica subsp. enterica serovar Virchow]
MSARADAPKRVVSMNLCTDQMAMLVAAPGQLYSVSYLASDTGSSVLAAEAGAYAVNHGLAEEIFLMQPDLVLAGTYTTRATVQLLQRLGIPVVEFAPENSFDDIRSNLRRMGEALGQPQRAAALIAGMDSALAATATAPGPSRTVATYYANSYTSGAGTLVDAIIRAAGLTNIASELGYAGTARLPLEQLILAQPDILVDGGQDYSTPALAQQNFEHPAYRRLAQSRIHVDVPAKYTICGAPFTVEAVRRLEGAGR